MSATRILLSRQPQRIAIDHAIGAASNVARAEAGVDRVGGQARCAEPPGAERRAGQGRRAPQGRELRPARALAPSLRPEAQPIAARRAGTPAHDLTASGPAPIVQPLFTHRALYSRHASGSLPKRRGAATCCERVILATAARRHANVTVAQQSSNPVALRSAHGRTWLAVLLLAITAVIIRMIAAQPLFSTLRICFGNWADKSRQREPEPVDPAVH